MFCSSPFVSRCWVVFRSSLANRATAVREIGCIEERGSAWGSAVLTVCVMQRGKATIGGVTMLGVTNYGCYQYTVPQGYRAADWKP